MYTCSVRGTYTCNTRMSKTLRPQKIYFFELLEKT